MEKNLNVFNRNFKTINEMFCIESDINIFAGPCSIESYDQMEQIAIILKKNDVRFIRGGAFKPRTSPYSFQGLYWEGLEIIDCIRKKYNLIAVSEILDTRDVEKSLSYIDIIQIGSKNMMNYSLLKEVGKTKTPIFLKRGFMATYDELLYAAEYIISEGNDKLILCERGIRTYESSTRNTLDLSTVALIKEETALPVVVDISHSLGRTDIAFPISRAALSVGADGIMVEVHPNPNTALSDNYQQLSLDEFDRYLYNVKSYNHLLHRLKE